MAKLIFGCGYVGRRVALRWLEQGAEVFAVTRKPERASEFRKMGISPVIGDVAEPLTLPPFEQLETVLYAVGFDRGGAHSIEEVYVNGFARALNALPEIVGRLIYVSSTGVYGQATGEWVDEDSPCRPEREGGKAVLAAEHVLADDALGERSVVLRLAGIYGPGRVPKIDDLRQGNALAVDNTSFLNLIHVDDVVEAIVSAEAVKRLPAKYVVADGCPVRRADFYREVARLLRVEPPRFVDPIQGSASSQRAASSKRVRNTRMVAELLPRLHYPSYREGLENVIRSEAE